MGQSNSSLQGKFKIDITKTLQAQDASLKNTLSKLNTSLRDEITNRIAQRRYSFKEDGTVTISNALDNTTLNGNYDFEETQGKLTLSIDGTTTHYSISLLAAGEYLLVKSEASEQDLLSTFILKSVID
jgi:hypothetical protein